MAKKTKLDPEIEKRVKKGVAHFEETMGHLPIQMETLSTHMPEVFAGYMDIRQWTMRPNSEGAMERKYKHLILSLLDCVYGNVPGATNHGRAALRTGMTVDQLLEGWGCLMIVGGIGVFGTTGFKVLNEVLASDEGKAAAKKSKQKAK